MVKARHGSSHQKPQHREGQGKIIALRKSQVPLGYTVNERLSQKKKVTVFSFKIEYSKFRFELDIINLKMQLMKYEYYQMLPYLYLPSL